VNNLNDFSVQFSGLTLGKHYFKFKIEEAFFDLFEYSEVDNGSIHLVVEMEKRSTMLVFQFSFEGKVKLICDRCGDPFDAKINGVEKQIVQFGNEQYEQTDDIVVLPESEYEINLAKYAYEFIILNLPVKRLHEEGECNQEAIDNLNKVLSKEEDKPTDPRWKALEGLK